MNSEPLVSVIVTTFNRADLLRETLDSILSQTYNNFELIVVDDGSTDNTEEVVKEYIDSRLQYIKTDNWGGPARPRNVGIKESKGEYIAFCDDDDLWYSNKLTYQLEQFRNNSYGLCFTNYDYIDRYSNKINRKHKIKKRYLNLTFNKFILAGGCILNSSVMIKREVVDTVGLINEDLCLIAIEDRDYWARILKKYKAVSIDKELVSYRINSINSIWDATKNNWLIKEIDALNSINSAVKINVIIYYLKIMKLILIVGIKNVLCKKGHK